MQQPLAVLQRRAVIRGTAVYTDWNLRVFSEVPPERRVMAVLQRCCFQVEKCRTEIRRNVNGVKTLMLFWTWNIKTDSLIKKKNQPVRAPRGHGGTMLML